MESIFENELTTVEEFLSTIPSKATRKNYKNSIRKFEEYLGRSIESLLEKKGNLGKIIEKYYVWLREKGYKQNSCRAYTNGPIQFLKYNNLDVRIRRSLGINRTEIGTSDHFLTIDQARKMHRVADLKEKVILKIWTWGLRVGDSCRLEWKLFDVLDQKPPIPMEILTRKERVVAYPFVDEELLELLKLYLPTLNKKNQYLFQTKRLGRMHEESLNWTVKSLAERAGIKIVKNFRWHIARKLFLRTCAENGVVRWNAKFLCGKSVARDIETYLNGLSLKNDFLKVSRVLRLEPVSEASSKDLENLEKLVEVMSKALANTLMKSIKEEMKKMGYPSFMGVTPEVEALAEAEGVDLTIAIVRVQRERAKKGDVDASVDSEVLPDKITPEFLEGLMNFIPKKRKELEKFKKHTRILTLSEAEKKISKILRKKDKEVKE